MQSGGFWGKVKSLEQLSGPVSVTYHQNINGKDIIIMGDKHGSFDNMCQHNISLTDYLKEYFTQVPHKVDFFLEEFFSHKKNKSPNQIKKISGPLNDLHDLFKSCFMSDKSQCSSLYPNVRFHYADLRTVNYEGTYFNIIWYELRNIFDNEKYYEFQEKFITKVDSNILYNLIFDYILKKFSDLNFPFEDEITDIAEGISEEIIQNKIKKQLESLDKEMYDKIIIFFQDYFKKLVEDYKNYRQNFMDNKDNKRKLIIFDISDILTDIAVGMMDIYLLSRLFKPSLSDSKEAIIFAGEFHSKNYRKFITENFNTNVISGKEISFRCQDITDIRKEYLQKWDSKTLIERHQNAVKNYLLNSKVNLKNF